MALGLQRQLTPSLPPIFTAKLYSKRRLRENAVAESFFGSLKTERVFFSNDRTREDARRDIIDSIEMFTTAEVFIHISAISVPGNLKR